MKNQSDICRIIMVNNPDLIKLIKLTDKQVNLVRLVQKYKSIGMRTTDLALSYNTTTQNASAQLNKLWAKGYLNRKEIKDSTGGYVYEYSIANVLRFIKIPQQ